MNQYFILVNHFQISTNIEGNYCVRDFYLIFVIHVRRLGVLTTCRLQILLSLYIFLFSCSLSFLLTLSKDCSSKNQGSGGGGESSSL